MAYKILIVDDATIVRLALMAGLKKSSIAFEFIQAANGQEALEKILKEKPDLVITDIEMPVMSGIELLKEMGTLKRTGQIEKIPVIVLSGTMFENEANVRKAKMFGATAVFAKPKGESSTMLLGVKEIEACVVECLKK